MRETLPLPHAPRHRVRERSDDKDVRQGFMAMSQSRGKLRASWDRKEWRHAHYE